MYWEIPQGSKINIQGLECNLPPEGYVFNITTKQLEYRGVYSRSDIPEQQYWERIPLPDWYKKVIRAEDDYNKKKKEDDPEFYDEKYEEYKRQEWDRRLNGFWFRNFNPIKKESEAIYLPGIYYFLLQWWPIDVGYAKFTIPHLNSFYFLEYCVQDPDCMGMIEITKRRFLKTYKGGLFVTEYPTRTKMTVGGMQSKTGNDIKKVFGKAVVSPFKRLPRFFRPEYDMSLGFTPKTEIRFQKTNIRGKKAEDNLDKEELGSMIDWQSADVAAYDGQKLHRYFCDEFGKTVEANVFDRHEVIRYCLLDEEGRIIGKALYSTTVEKLESDKDGVQEAAKQLWDASDQFDKEDGKTKSGLYRFFQTADESKNIDIYGYPDVEKTVKEILADRERVKNNPRALAARMHKEPRTVEEAFSANADECIFNSYNIMEREKFLAENPEPKREIIFWMDEEKQEVKWRDAVGAEKDFCWRFSKYAELGKFQANKYIFDGPIRKPGRTRDGAISVDSYSNSQGGRKYGSKASAWVGRKYDINNPEHTGKPVGHLYGRPKEKEELHRQVMLAAIFFGYKVWYEHAGGDDYVSYFRDRGKIGYLGKYPWSLIDVTKRHKENLERFYGTPVTPFSLTKQLDNGISFFENYCERLDFEEIFPQAKKFDPYNRTESDIIVSLLILITVLFEPERLPQARKTPLVKVYPNYGAATNYN